jgi:hypothetical protein
MIDVETGPGWALVVAYGGNRRSRGSRIAAWKRSHPEATLVRIERSETYGFQSASYAHYELPKS